MTITIFICYAAKSAKKSGRSLELQKRNQSTSTSSEQNAIHLSEGWGRDSHLFSIPDLDVGFSQR